MSPEISAEQICVGGFYCDMERACREDLPESSPDRRIKDSRQKIPEKSDYCSKTQLLYGESELVFRNLSSFFTAF